MKLPSISSANMQNAAIAGLRLAGWLAVNSLIALGLLSLAAFTIGSFSLDLTMHHLANLSTRYMAADLARQSQFSGIVLMIVIGGFAATAFFRRHSLRYALTQR